MSCNYNTQRLKIHYLYILKSYKISKIPSPQTEVERKFHADSNSPIYQYQESAHKTAFYGKLPSFNFHFMTGNRIMLLKLPV